MGAQDRDLIKIPGQSNFERPCCTKCSGIAAYEGLRAWSSENFRASGLKANQAEVCHTRALITLPLLVCMCACLSIKEIKCANNCIDDASSLVWIFDLSYAALFIQAFAGAIRCPIEELLVRVKRILCGGFCIKFGSSKFHMLANSLIGKNATIVLMKINTSVIFLCV